MRPEKMAACHWRRWRNVVTARLVLTKLLASLGHCVEKEYRALMQ